MTRLDPDELLRKIQEEEQKEISGKLKVFFGMIAGVGKTYAMLNAARGLKKEGVDVVVAYVETHGRKETEELLEGLEILPRKKWNIEGSSSKKWIWIPSLGENPKLYWWTNLRTQTYREVGT